MTPEQKRTQDETTAAMRELSAPENKRAREKRKELKARKSRRSKWWPLVPQQKQPRWIEKQRAVDDREWGAKEREQRANDETIAAVALLAQVNRHLAAQDLMWEGPVITQPVRKEPIARGAYVYAWHDGDALIYIGKGRDNRATAAHDGRSEGLRQLAGDSWRYEILVDNLSDDVAYATERALIHLLDPPGNTQLITRVAAGPVPSLLYDR